MDIKPYTKNAKKHPKKQIEQVAASIKEFGMNQPIVVDKQGVIIVGHGRYEALQSLGMKVTPEMVKVVDLTEEQAKAYRLADNKLNESEWDMTLVVEELKGLSEPMLDLTGFDKDLIIEPDEADDEVPDLPEEPQSKLGDLYELGEHRVLCGDSTSIEDVEKLMNGKRADISFTSPPYNVGHNLGYDGKDSKYIHSDDKTDYQQLIVDTTNNSLAVSKDVFVNLQFLAGNKKELLLWLAELADNFKDIFFWKKKTAQPAMAENVANSQVEVIVLFGTENNSRSWGNKRFRGTFSNAIETSSAGGENKNAKIHNATYPVELPLSFLKAGYESGSIVLDLFAGTGTTMIASEKLGQKCYMVDIEPAYVDVIVQRYVDYTGNATIKLNGQEIIWQAKKQVNQ
jgi:site-specific DNA-methyltransferase (adenine-specific)